ncbi:MAG TPA: right-handed parallel beta-helix repeat-containing protein [Verrucomicrobiae bacterium]|nr:right-handed parallel beta-helix repeat-containing protein [Verrucomicrobiae bacterium]
MRQRISVRVSGYALLLAGLCLPAAAATLCVNPSGKGGCSTKINDAVAKAAPGDRIQVASGTYKEDVIIGKALSLIGHDADDTKIDATGLANGVYVDGVDNAGLKNVVVSGFTIENANFQGILVTNASSITISGNDVINNDKALNVSATPPCANLPPALQPGEGLDCGEGIHLTGVTNSTVAHNLISGNSGGVLISDDTGATHDNVISGNSVHDNPYDCGITLASHNPTTGVYHNTISGNDVSHNGFAVGGAGAGVGLFAPFPGTQTYGNLVVNNRLTNNGLPGVTMHSHVPGTPAPNLNDNVIIGNQISGNNADTADAATPGPTGINIYGVAPITGIVILNNNIDNEAVDVAFKASGAVSAVFNNLGDAIGVDNLGTGTVNALENWWGCPGGPNGGNHCATVVGTVDYTPWLTRPIGGNGNHNR